MCDVPVLSFLEFLGIRILGMWEREDRKVEDTKNSLFLNWEKQTEPMMYIILTNKQANEHISSSIYGRD